MKVSIDPGSGFCFGVKEAIRAAQAELDAGNNVYSLGEIVHNQVQMNILKSKGLKVISLADLPLHKGEKVLFRAHGEPPETYTIARNYNIEVIDATCPIVIKLQKHIKKASVADSCSEVQIVIFGKAGHAEVAGLNGNAGNKAIIIESTADFEKIDFSKPIRLFSQTTMDGEGYKKICSAVEQRMLETANTDLEIKTSVCRQVSDRAPHLRKFAAKHDVIIFVGGNNSANGAYLFGICHDVNERSYYVSDAEDIKSIWFEGAHSAGITGATSTPEWLIEQVASFIEKLQ